MTSEQDRTENFDDFENEIESVDGNITSNIYSQIEDTDGSFTYGKEDEDLFSRLGGSSDDPEQKRSYIEYLSLIKEIHCQNDIIDNIKKEINDLCCKKLITNTERLNIKWLRDCLKHEVTNLQYMIKKATKLQNFGSHRHYLDLQLATTLDEDNIKPYGCFVPTEKKHTEYNFCGAERSSSFSNECQEKVINSTSGHKNLCTENKKHSNDSNKILFNSCKHRERMKNVNPYSCKETLENESLEQLNKKVICMQILVNNLKDDLIKNGIANMNESRCCQDVKSNRSQTLISNETLCLPEHKNSENIEKLNVNYLYLLSEYFKKDCELKQMEQRLKEAIHNCSQNTEKCEPKKKVTKSVEEYEQLRAQISDLNDNIYEFKCVMKDQSFQLEDYRMKYLEAQQKVEEQNIILDKLNISNKKIQNQINEEMIEVRKEFQQKLKELIRYPKLLENVRSRLCRACKEKEELQGKLMHLCKELKIIKSQKEFKHDKGIRFQLENCQKELCQIKIKIEEIENQRNSYFEQLKSTKCDLDTLRSESAKIIARTKERTEMIRQHQQQQLTRLEKNLAQCRAKACLSVSNRENIIREMQFQLNTLSQNFNSAQKQIKTLRNHIMYVSNDKNDNSNA